MSTTPGQSTRITVAKTVSLELERPYTGGDKANGRDPANRGRLRKKGKVQR